MLDRLKRLFQSKPHEMEPSQKRSQIEERFESLVTQLHTKLGQFLVTRSAATGEIARTKEWTLSKTGAALFRLESDTLSLLINTEPFLTMRDGKLSGLLRMSEAALCRAIADKGGVSTFFRISEPLKKRYRDQIPESSRPGDAENPGIDDLLLWDEFDIYQMVARNAPNTLVHVLIHADPRTSMKISEQLSVRKKEMLLLEMESLLSGGTAPSMNPHSKNRSLVEYEDALIEFRFRMKEYLLEKNLRLKKQKLPSSPVDRK